MSIKKATVVITKTFTKKLDAPDAYENTYRHSFQAKLDDEEVWFGLPSNKMDALMVEEGDSWKIVGAGSTVFIKYTEDTKGDKTYRNVKKNDFTVTDLVEGAKYQPQAPATTPAAKPAWNGTSSSTQARITFGMCMNNACNQLGTAYTPEKLKERIIELHTIAEEGALLAEKGKLNTWLSGVKESVVAEKPKTKTTQSPKKEIPPKVEKEVVTNNFDNFDDDIPF